MVMMEFWGKNYWCFLLLVEKKGNWKLKLLRYYIEMVFFWFSNGNLGKKKLKVELDLYKEGLWFYV